MSSKNKSYYAFEPLHSPVIQLDLSRCTTLDELHHQLKTTFGFPEYYGENWSALWDCLDGLFEDEGEITIEVFGYTDMSEEMQQGCRTMLDIFKDAEKTMPNVHFTIF